MPDVILHHYPQSPVSEKVRVVLGIKDLDWRSVIIPRLPPKPDLMPLTGGYRLTPVMQIGADVYCDSQCIIRRLESLKPEPTLFPGGAKGGDEGLAWGLGRWIDGPLFTSAIAMVFGALGDDLPAEFAADRGPLYFGDGFELATLVRALPETIVQVRAQIGWMEQAFAGRDFMAGDRPGLADALCYYLVWFLRGRYARGPGFLAQFPALVEWEARIEAIGHGRPQEMDAKDALAQARDAAPDTGPRGEADEAAGIAPGDRVAVVPMDLGLCPAVTGRVVALDFWEIAIHREDETVGDVVVHFPRAGYRAEKV